MPDQLAPTRAQSWADGQAIAVDVVDRRRPWPAVHVCPRRCWRAARPGRRTTSLTVVDVVPAARQTDAVGHPRPGSTPVAGGHRGRAHVWPPSVLTASAPCRGRRWSACTRGRGRRPPGMHESAPSATKTEGRLPNWFHVCPKSVLRADHDHGAVADERRALGQTVAEHALHRHGARRAGWRRPSGRRRRGSTTTTPLDEPFDPTARQSVLVGTGDAAEFGRVAAGDLSAPSRSRRRWWWRRSRCCLPPAWWRWVRAPRRPSSVGVGAGDGAELARQPRAPAGPAPGACPAAGPATSAGPGATGSWCSPTRSVPPRREGPSKPPDAVA